MYRAKKRISAVPITGTFPFPCNLFSYFCCLHGAIYFGEVCQSPPAVGLPVPQLGGAEQQCIWLSWTCLLVNCGQWAHIHLRFTSIRYIIGPICRGGALRLSVQSTFPIFFPKGFRLFVSSSRTSIIAKTCFLCVSLNTPSEIYVICRMGGPYSEKLSLLRS